MGRGGDNATEKEPVVFNTHDLTAKRNEWHVTPPGPLNAVLKGMIKEERDLPILYLFVNVICFTLPAAATVFYVGSNWLGLAYYVRCGPPWPGLALHARACGPCVFRSKREG